MDKVGRNTGIGKVSPERLSGLPDAVIAVSLFNYNFDGNLPKDEHKEYLRSQLVPFVRARDMHLKLHGVASRVGNADYNRQLSLERVLRVKKYLIAQGLTEAQVPGTEMRATGEDLVDAAHEDDSELDRAVWIYVALGRKWRPIPPDIVFPPDQITILPTDRIEGLPIQIVPPRFHKVPIKVSRRWKIRMVSAVEGTLAELNPLISVGAASMVFQIVDLENNQTVYAIMPAVQVGGPATGGVTLDGPWSTFRTANPHRIGEFGGAASWNVAYSAATLSKGWIAFRNVPSDFSEVFAKEVLVNTGPTIGAGVLSTAQGKLILSVPEPYAGE